MGGEVPPAAAVAGVLAGRVAAGHAAGVRAAASRGAAPLHHLYPAECRQLRLGLRATAAADPEPVRGSGQATVEQSLVQLKTIDTRSNGEEATVARQDVESVSSTLVNVRNQSLTII